MRETELTRSFATVIEHVKNKVRNNMVTAHRKSLVRGLDDNQVKQICNIIDASVDEAATQAIGPEARGLMSKIQKEITASSKKTTRKSTKK